MKNIFLIVLAFFAFFTQTFAQKGLELGAGIGASNYYGDLNSDFGMKKIGLSAGVVGRYNFNERICLKFSGNWANISADDVNSNNAFEKERNLHFKSVLLDGAGQLEFNFLPYYHGSKDQFFSPYIFMGLGVVNFNPQALYNGNWVELRELGTEGQFRGEEYYSTIGTFVYGGGIKVDVSYDWSINVDLGIRYAFTDYLDDVSTVYPDFGDLKSLRGEDAVNLSNRTLNDTAFKGFQRGNAQNNDAYAILNVGLLYYFGSIKCPDF